MSVQIPTIDIHRYNSTINVRQPARNLRHFARSIRDDIISDTNITSFSNVSIHVTVLEQLNIRYTEKQVRGIDENFVDYHNGTRIRNVNPAIPLRGVPTYLTVKSFSGDVSGDIGETVFVYLLTEVLGMNGQNIGHLRPEKRRKQFTPDFIIFERNSSLDTLFNNSYNPPLYAEVKSSTGIMDTNRIDSALVQLRTVMRPNSHSLLFLLYKRLANRYNGLLIGVVS